MSLSGIRRLFGVWLVALLLVLALPACQPGHETAAHAAGSQAQMPAGPAAEGRDPHSGLPFIALAELPAEAQQTLDSIKRGGPFAYDRDGVVFGNYERVLPKRPRGYYHEYTVKTPGVRSRGARRIISGGTDEFYYTADHYQSFKRIRE